MADTIRVNPRRGYTVLQNDMILDKRLSLKTKGLMAVILSRPDGWEFSVGGLSAFCGCGKDAIRGALKELETAGYLTRQQLHGEDGTFKGNVYVIQESSVHQKDEDVPLSDYPTTGSPSSEKSSSEKPSSEKPSSEKPSSENPTQRNKDLKKEGLKESPLTPQGGQEPVFCALPLRDGTAYLVDGEELAKWKALYPHLDVEQQFRNMIGWLSVSPERRKTRRGIGRFIASWLSRRADKPPEKRMKGGDTIGELVL